MKRFTCLFFALGLAACGSLRAQPLVWVSGVGDDANPGSRTAPCKTFQGVMSKVGAGGQINALDPGNFGTVTIVKTITIDGGNFPVIITTGSAVGAMVSVASVNPANVMTIRNVWLNGAGTNTYGVQMVNCSQLRIENCSIYGCLSDGIHIVPGTSGGGPGPVNVYLKNCKIFNCGSNGVYINPSSGQSVSVTLDNCQIEGCGNGVYIDNSGSTNTVFVHNCVINQNSGAGITAGGGLDFATVEGSEVNLNGSGIVSSGAVTISDSTIMGNKGAGLTNAPGGAIVTYHNNRILGNSPDGAPTRSAPLR